MSALRINGFNRTNGCNYIEMISLDSSKYGEIIDLLFKLENIPQEVEESYDLFSSIFEYDSKEEIKNLSDYEIEIISRYFIYRYENTYFNDISCRLENVEFTNYENIKQFISLFSNFCSKMHTTCNNEIVTTHLIDLCISLDHVVSNAMYDVIKKEKKLIKIKLKKTRQNLYSYENKINNIKERINANGNRINANGNRINANGNRIEENDVVIDGLRDRIENNEDALLNAENNIDELDRMTNEIFNKAILVITTGIGIFILIYGTNTAYQASRCFFLS